MEKQNSGNKMFVENPSKAPTANLPNGKSSQVEVSRKRNFGKQRLLGDLSETLDFDASSSHSRLPGTEFFHGDALSHTGADGTGFLNVENRVSISLGVRPKEELVDLKVKLQLELVSVRNLMKRIERYSGKKLLVDNDTNDGGFRRVHSEADSVAGSCIRGLMTGIVGEEMLRSPMVGPLQENLDVTLSSEKASVSAQTNKSKGNNKKNAEKSASLRGESSSSKVFKSCSSLLNKLMKCKGSWWFNEPVDVENLGLDDYFTIIKHPMDLGTVKSRLSTNSYKSPQEFAEDVRLTFRNAMTYNMDGHEVYAFAKQFLKTFEDKWAVLEADYLQQMSMTADSAVPDPVVPTGIQTGGIELPVAGISQSIERLEPKSSSLVASGKTRLPKPKARDPHKRDMTLEEKQKLNESLQNLPPEKLEGVVRIIKKRNPSMCQNDDEIEVDIDTVDTETLWELDRFVIYYRKALSKVRRSAKLPQMGVMVEPNLDEKNRADYGIVEAKECETDEKNIFSSASNEGEQEGGHAGSSDGSSSSSSDSGSSSSGSDTDSSSS